MPIPKMENGKITIVYDKNNPEDIKKMQRKEKTYINMNKIELIKLVETLLKE